MEPISGQVTEAMQGALRLEREAFSQFHDEEHHEEYRRNGKLESWYDSLVHDSRTRRRRLLRRLFATDATPDPDPGSPVASVGDEMAGLKRTRDMLNSLRAAYRGLYRVASSVSDAQVAEIATKGMANVEQSICKADAFIDKEKKMGRPVWLGDVVQ